MPIIERVPTLTQRVTEELRRAIIDGELAPGSLHSATNLGTRLGVSRTPVREAANELARLGLVAIEPNRGIRVLRTDIDSLLNGFELRMIIEAPLTRKAALSLTDEGRERLASVFKEFASAAESGDSEATLRADRDFHTTVLELAGNERATEVLREQRNMVLKSGVGTVPTSRTSLECYADHIDVFEAIMGGDGDAAAASMFRHILNTATMLIKQETEHRPELAELDVRERLSWLAQIK